ncbi:MAG TPA: hypothetical protein VKB51_04500 [bacterium]|nr:hypothetical protein [bacterium]
MTTRKLDAEFILTLAEAVQEVTLPPEQAERMAALQARFNGAVLAQRGRVPLEAEPADFVRLLKHYRDEAP